MVCCSCEETWKDHAREEAGKLAIEELRDWLAQVALLARRWLKQMPGLAGRYERREPLSMSCRTKVLGNSSEHSRCDREDGSRSGDGLGGVSGLGDGRLLQQYGIAPTPVRTQAGAGRQQQRRRGRQQQRWRDWEQQRRRTPDGGGSGEAGGGCTTVPLTPSATGYVDTRTSLNIVGAWFAYGGQRRHWRGAPRDRARARACTRRPPAPPSSSSAAGFGRRARPRFRSRRRERCASPAPRRRSSVRRRTTPDIFGIGIGLDLNNSQRDPRAVQREREPCHGVPVQRLGPSDGDGPGGDPGARSRTRPETPGPTP